MQQQQGSFSQASRNAVYFFPAYASIKPATRWWEIDPPKFSQTYVFVRYSNKLHHFAPPKISVGCDPGQYNLASSQCNKGDKVV